MGSDGITFYDNTAGWEWGAEKSINHFVTFQFCIVAVQHVKEEIW
jgi:hypothetical protein